MLGSLVLLLLVLVAVPGWAQPEYSDCPDNVITLENALYADGRNILELARVFYPPGSSSPRFIIVDYQFLNESNQIGDCNVSYAWSTSPFLIFLPPKFFEWSSLHFYYPESELDHLQIVLPYECRPLVNSSSNCTCDVVDHTMLDHLTQQMSIYAQYNNRDSITREETKARSICSRAIETGFYLRQINRVLVLYALICLVIPVFGTLAVFAIFRNAESNSIKNLVKPDRHAQVVGAVLTGHIYVIYIYVHDIAASYHIINNIESYNRDVSFYTPHFAFVHLTLAFHTVLFVSLIPIWLYIFYCSIMQFCGRPRKLRYPPFMISIFAMIVGKKNTQFIRKLSDNDLIAFSIPYMLVPPIFMTLSHLGYIIASWLVGPHKATVSLFVSYLYTAFFYIAFKNVANVQSHVTYTTRPMILPKQVEENQMISLSHTPTEDDDSAKSATPPPTQEEKKQNPSEEKEEIKPKGFSFKVCGKFYINYGDVSEYLNIQMLVFDLICSIFFSIVATLALSIFVIIPGATESIFTYVVNIFHIIIILVTAQVSIKIFAAVNFSIDNFMDVFRERLSSKKITDANERVLSIAKSEAETTEVVGTVAADITNAVINKFKDD